MFRIAQLYSLHKSQYWPSFEVISSCRALGGDNDLGLSLPGLKPDTPHVRQTLYQPSHRHGSNENCISRPFLNKKFI